MSDEKLRTVLKLVTNEITIDILLKTSSRKPLKSSSINEEFRKEIGANRVDKLYRMISSNDNLRNPWKLCSSLFRDFTCIRRREYSLKRKNKNLHCDQYKRNVLSEVLRMLLDCELTDVNRQGKNGNSILHLVVSLPIETERDSELKKKLLQELVYASADCSLKNAQEMTPLHIVAGNYTFDPDNEYVLSQNTGISSDYYSRSRLQIFHIFQPLLKTPYLERGQHGNSILHEWVIYSSMMANLSEEEKQIGLYIISQANVSFHVTNDYSCTALHFATSKDVLDFLCQHKADHDSNRLNSDGDTPVLHIMKYGILRQLNSFVKSLNGFDMDEALSNDVNISFNKELLKLHNARRASDAVYKQPPLNEITDVFQSNGFKVAALDSKGKNCLDYILHFLYTLSTQCQDTLRRIPEEEEHLPAILSWTENVTKPGSAFDSTTDREKTISCLLYVLFEGNPTTEKMFVDFVTKLFEHGADPNKIHCQGDCPILEYCCSKNLSDNSLKKEVIELLCKNGVKKYYTAPDDDLQHIIESTKPKQRVTIEIQSVRYRQPLEDLSREVHPRRIDDSKPFRYHEDCIGKGAISDVFLAIDENIPRELALKRIVKTSTKEIEAEKKALTDLADNSNVIKLYQIEETNDFYYLGIELMDGDLQDLVTDKKHDLEDKEMVRTLAADVLRGLEYLHEKGMVHRDIKPGNILYRETPKLTLKLADFGLTKHSNCDQSNVMTTNSSSLCGTRGWMAPELITRALKSPNKETDMFALGLVLHYLFSKGFHPFHSKEESLFKLLTNDTLQPHKLESGITDKKEEIHHALSPEQKHLVMFLLKKNAKERPVSKDLLKIHCCFWSNIKKVEFICKVGDQPEVATPAKCQNSTFEINLNNSELGRSFSGSGWNTNISPVLYSEMTKKRTYKTNSVTDLIRMFRNAYAHYEEKSPQCRVEILNDEIFKKFPDFVVTVLMEVMSQGWYPPQSSENNIRDKLQRVFEEMD